jgi:hypothetical protein
MRTYSVVWCATVFMSALILGACARHHGEEANSVSSSAADGGHEPRDAGPSQPHVEEAAHVGAKASVTLDPIADGKINGQGTFSETAQGIDFELRVRGCANINDAKPLPLVIMQGADCSDASLLGARWDSPRGEGIPSATCTGARGGGRTFYTRLKSDAKPWTVGTPDASNVIGHALVVYDPETLQPGACGVIGREPDKQQASPTAKGATAPSEAARAVISSLCLGRMLVRDNTQDCPNPKELNACASMHCEVDACLAQCTDYTACLDQQMNAGTDICQASLVQCQITQVCSTCIGEVSQCVLGFCADQIGCASPVMTNGPCSKLEACCNQQGDADSQPCLDTVHLLEKLSGDPSCYGAMHDWDTTAHLKVPCMFQ